MTQTTASSPQGLQSLVERAARAPSPFYAERLARAGLVGAGAVDVGALAHLPLTYRDEILRDQLDHPPHGRRRCADAAPPVRAGITGSGADLLVLTWTAADLSRERAAGARLLGGLGIARGMRVANTLAGALTTPGSLLLGDVVEDIGALDVPLGSVDTEAGARQAWELIDRVEPDVLVVDRASATRLFAATRRPAAERRWLRGIVWLRCGAAKEERTTVPDAVEFAGWQRTWLAVPEASSFVAHSCAAGLLHVDPGVMAEVAAGDTLVLTPLGGDTPLLRYDSGVPARLVTSACGCGEDGQVVELR